MKNLTIIIPIHKINEDIKKLLETAYNSVVSMENIDGTKVMIVGPENVLSECKTVLSGKTYADEIVLFEKNDKTDFCSQVNFGAKKCKTDYFSILEFDDTFKKKWLKNVEKYLEFFGDTSVLLPLTELCDTDNNMLSFINEVAWASSFSNELSFLDLDCLQVYMDFNVTGGIIRTEDFVEVGGLKSSLKIASWYEFLMRLCHNGKKVMVIPKVGYSHIINRDDSLMKQQQEEITPEEGAWLIKTAQQEYFYKEDRKKEFNKS